MKARRIEILHFLAKYIFPSRCVICDTVLPFGDKLENEHLCKSCREKVEFIKEPTCKKCGAMIHDADETFCTRCKLKLYESFIYGFGLCRYNDSIKSSLHRIKYGGRKEYIEFYGKLIAKMHHEKFKNINPDYLVPVPIHKKRYIERSFNQATVLAHSISKELKQYGVDIPVNENLVYRIKDTKVLNKLDNNSRKTELNNAFFVNKDESIEKVMIIDDIYTTGATIDAIASCLKKSGVQKIYFTTIAIVDNL